LQQFDIKLVACKCTLDLPARKMLVRFITIVINRDGATLQNMFNDYSNYNNMWNSVVLGVSFQAIHILSRV